MTTTKSIFVAIVLAISTSMLSFSVLNANAQTESTTTHVLARYLKGCN